MARTMRASLVLGIVLVGTAALADAPPSTGPADTINIPLDSIHALNMPGTRPLDPIESHEGEFKTASGPFVKAICIELARMKQPRAGFAVPGQGEDAVQEAQRVLVEKQEPRGLRAGQRASLFFFSKPFGAYVHLRSVTMEPAQKRITIIYRFVPHETRRITPHLAVIPLPDLPAGAYDVALIGQLDDRQDERTPGAYVKQWEPQVICRPFSFILSPPTPKKK